jgi:hypothetical protein
LNVAPAVYLGTKLVLEVTGPAELAGKRAHFIGGLRLNSAGGNPISFANRTLELPFEINDWFFQFSLHNLLTTFVDQGNGNSKARLEVDVPTDSALRGTYHLFSAVVDPSNATLLGTTGSPIQFRIQVDTSREEAALAALRENLSTIINERDINSKKVKRFQKRIKADPSKKQKLKFKIRTLKKKIKFANQKTIEINSEIQELEAYISSTAI